MKLRTKPEAVKALGINWEDVEALKSDSQVRVSATEKKMERHKNKALLILGVIECPECPDAKLRINASCAGSVFTTDCHLCGKKHSNEGATVEDVMAGREYEDNLLKLKLATLQLMMLEMKESKCAEM